MKRRYYGVATPTSQPPWEERRSAWLKLLAPASEGGQGRYIQMGVQHPFEGKQRERDLERLIKEGLAKQAGKPRASNRHPSSGRRKFLILTEAGLLAWNETRPTEPRTATPYAKRKAALAEMQEDQPTKPARKPQP